MPHFDEEWRIVGRQINDRLNEIRGSIHGHRSPIKGWQAVVTGHKQGPSAPPEDGWEPFEMGSVWGGKDVTMWFKADAPVPEGMAGKRVVAVLRPGGESLTYIDGEPCQGLDRNRDEILLLEKAKGDEKFGVLIESYSHARFDEKHTFQRADLATVNVDIHKFYWSARVVFDTLQILPQGSGSQLRMLDLLNKCVKMVDLGHKGDDRYTESIAEAQKTLDL